MNTTRCTFCDQEIDRSRMSAHYRYKHRRQDLDARRTRVNRRRGRRPRQLHRSSLRLNVHIPSVRNLPDLPDLPPLDNCVMCLDDHHTELLPCGHTSSCATCLMRWWKGSYHRPSCPICRTETETVVDRGVRTNRINDWRRWRAREISRSLSHVYFRRWDTIVS